MTTNDLNLFNTFEWFDRFHRLNSKIQSNYPTVRIRHKTIRGRTHLLITDPLVYGVRQTLVGRNPDVHTCPVTLLFVVEESERIQDDTCYLIYQRDWSSYQVRSFKIKTSKIDKSRRLSSPFCFFFPFFLPRHFQKFLTRWLRIDSYGKYFGGCTSLISRPSLFFMKSDFVPGSSRFLFWSSYDLWRGQLVRNE